jgi:outer membrane protein assembly factor BamB
LGFSFLILMLVSVSAGAASDWPSWRGPYQTGVSDETGLVSNWSLDGENLLWKAKFTSRSTPIVMNGRVYVNGRTGEGVTMQRHIACFDAETGKLIWEQKHNVFHTTVPFTRVEWSNLAGDPETGNVYLFGVDGWFVCFDKDGKILWQVSFEEEFNRFSGYGGRTATPVVDEDLVIVNYINNSWGDQLVQKNRLAAYDKRTGEQVWVSALSGAPKNTNYSVPVIAVIDGVRQLIVGGADGALYGLKARTGEELWKFSFSKEAVHTSPVVDGDKVYICHSEENFDSTVMGAVLCIDGTGKGDVTKTHQVWRADGIQAGYVSPMIHDGRLYVVTNSGNLIALDAATGKEYWTFNIGTVGKGSPVWADGKIYATEVNGGFHIIQLGDAEAKSLDRKNINFDERRKAEIYGSPAIAYGKVYFTTEEGLYCLGKKGASSNSKSSTKIELSDTDPLRGKEEPPDPNSPIAHIQIAPSEKWIYANQSIQFKVRAFDDKGRFLGEKPATFSVAALKGTVDAKGKFTPDKSAGNQAGYVVAKVGELESKSRVAVQNDLPWSYDFENFEVDKNPPLWPGASKFKVVSFEGGKVLAKEKPERLLTRHNLYLGRPEMTGYVIQADAKGTQEKRRSPDFGVINNRYYLDFQTKKQKLQIRDWPAELRILKEIEFSWNPESWYTFKMQVDYEGSKAVVKGKVWPRHQQEPAEWTLTVEDPLPNRNGSPGIHGDAVTNIYFDNIKITRSK